MAYLVRLRLRDTNLEFDTQLKRDAAYTKILSAAKTLGIPDDHVILEKIETRVSTFTGKIEEKVVGSN